VRYILLFLLLFSCGQQEKAKEEIRERNVVAYVCYNPDSIWHLSECNDECTSRDYDGDAYCHPLIDVTCEENRNATEFIRRACGLYYR